MTPQQLLALYNSALPGTLGTAYGQVGQADQALGYAAAGSNPIYTQSGLNQLNQYAPGYQQAGANLAQMQAGSSADLIQGQGGRAALSANALNNYINPAQAASNSQAANLVNSINLNGLSGGEQSAVERSLNQSNYATGNLGVDNATNAVSNAMNFGNALQAKRAALGSALGAATGVAQSQNNILNGGQFALGAGNGANNFGLGTFNPTQANANVTQPLAFSSNILSTLGQNASASRGSSGSKSLQLGAGGGACFLTTACCEYKGLPDDCEELTILRDFRDTYVPSGLIKEYYRIAPLIVPQLSAKQLESIYGTIKDCVECIKAGSNLMALDKYKSMVSELKGDLCLI
jgi:hypothetical protein